MAKSVGFIGTIRGRIGNVVFSRGIDGRTVMRAYQPQVSNPRTNAQRMQRAKVNVAGQFSGMVGKDVIAPLGMGSVRANRSEFIKKLLCITTASMSGNDATAQFPAAAVQFSNGNTPMCATMGPQAVTANSVQIPLTLTDAEKAGRYGEKLIVVVMNVAGNLPGGKVREVVSKDVVLTSTTAQSVTLGFSAPLTTSVFTSIVCRSCWTIAVLVSLLVPSMMTIRISLPYWLQTPALCPSGEKPFMEV